MKEDVKMVQMFLEKSRKIEDYGDDDIEPFSADVNSSEVVSFTTECLDDHAGGSVLEVEEDDFDEDLEFVGISRTQRKHYWGKESWTEVNNVAVADIKKASPLSVALAIGNEEIIALLKNAGAMSHSENATTPITYKWSLRS